MRSTPTRISPSTYPIAAAATARAYDFEEREETIRARYGSPAPDRETQVLPGQQPLFSHPTNEPRVIPFDQFTSPAERESIRARAADLARPAPMKSERVEVQRPRVNKRRSEAHDQRRLEFLGQEEVVSAAQSSIICDAPVAPPTLRMRAAAIDGFAMAIGCGVCVAIFLYAGGHIPMDKRMLPFFAAAVLTVPFFYKLLWTFMGQDTIGMKKTGIRLVDFDGNPPSRERRYYRLVGGIISLLAAGMGLIWAFVDEDALTWHDHISNTFPTIVAED
ncbi:MAG: RDD family protein [Acidobacteriota bacterium]|nr:RDD family protein [Acidobacteriota bacterium]